MFLHFIYHIVKNHTYILLTLCPRWDSTGISVILPRHPYLTKMRNTADLTGGSIFIKTANKLKQFFVVFLGHFNIIYAIYQRQPLLKYLADRAIFHQTNDKLFIPT
jgi:hypothetical protein